MLRRTLRGVEVDYTTQALDDGSPIDIVTMPAAKHLSSDEEEDERGFWHLEVEVEPEGGAANGYGGVVASTGAPSLLAKTQDGSATGWMMHLKHCYC